MPKGSATADAIKEQERAVHTGESNNSKEWEIKRERLSVTSEIHNILYSAAADSKSAMTVRDSEEWIEQSVSEKAFKVTGVETEEKKLEIAKDMKKYAIMFRDQAKEAGAHFLATIDKAESEKWITKSSADRWRAKLKAHSGSWPETRAFLKSFDREYVKNWEELHVDLQKIERIKKAFKVDERKVPELKMLKEPGFVDKKYPAKRNDISMILAALKEYMLNEEKVSKVRKTAEAALNKAVKDGAMSKYKIGPWLDHVISGKRSLPELLKFIPQWENIRTQYDTLEARMDRLEREPQGFKRIASPEKFLLLSYEQRVSYVQEARWRLTHHLKQPEDTPIEDFKGKIRHALDINEWEEAEYYLEKAKKIATGNDINELHSMEWHLENFRKDGDDAEPDLKMKDHEAVQKAYEEMDAAIQLIPGPLRSLYVKALCRGAETFRCVRKTTGNVIWCVDRGYLSEEILEDSREKAVVETFERTRPGGIGHGSGLENNLVDGYGEPAIRDKGAGPQNVFLSADGEDAFVNKADQNKDVYSFWYWTNCWREGMTIPGYRFVCEALHPVLTRAAYTMQKHGFVYSSSGPVSIN